jgi:hypothetical protein
MAGEAEVGVAAAADVSAIPLPLPFPSFLPSSILLTPSFLCPDISSLPAFIHPSLLVGVLSPVFAMASSYFPNPAVSRLPETPLPPASSPPRPAAPRSTQVPRGNSDNMVSESVVNSEAQQVLVSTKGDSVENEHRNLHG